MSTIKVLSSISHVVPVRFYQGDARPKNPVRLNDDEYAKTSISWVKCCADTVFINREPETFYLARRNQRPLKGSFWWFGGRRNFGDTPAQSAIRSIKRETGLEVDAGRLQLVAWHEYMFPDREEEPQDAGTHANAHQFAFEPTEKELVAVATNLDQHEFQGGLFKFTRPEIVKAVEDGSMHQAVLDIYDTVFQKERNLEVPFPGDHSLYPL